MTTSPTPPPLDYATPVVPAQRSFLRRFGLVLFVVLVIVFFMLMRQAPSSSAGGATTVSIGQFALEVNSGDLLSADVADDDVNFVTTSNRLPPSAGKRYRVELPVGTGSSWSFLQWLTEAHNGTVAVVRFSSRHNLVETLLMPLIPWILIFVFVWFFLSRFLNKARLRPTPVVIVNPEALR